MKGFERKQVETCPCSSFSWGVGFIKLFEEIFRKPGAALTKKLPSVKDTLPPKPNSFQVETNKRKMIFAPGYSSSKPAEKKNVPNARWSHILFT
ncbi:hypothetical protein P5673_014809 [Acropora cervicornis]|uniref:Uncharacterized protein n=1 Tax=Acropora cervicornis TaxID=6130 RepID=A0AAD9V5Q7_ACRCE|nr:hypothetical protein P5673_014809 [Acropora cervicornis]